MIYAVIGSRNFTDYNFVKQCLDLYNITTIVSGGARGADSLAARYAQENSIKLIVHEAKWSDLSQPCVIKTNSRGEKYNALAGHKRNQFIIDDCEAVIAFWDLKSPGTKNSLNYAKTTGKTIIVFKTPSCS